jgi:hypothetical protein
MYGLAMMAWRLAYRRTWGMDVQPMYFFPMPRECWLESWPTSAEYYRSCDRIARGETP